MSRSGYSDDYGGDEDYNNALELYRRAVRNAFAGKRGQAFLQELLAALDAMPEKRLIFGELKRDGAVCAIGSVGARRGIKMDDLDIEDADAIAKRFGIAPCMVREIEYANDDDFNYYRRREETPEERWQRVRSWAAAALANPRAV